VIKRIDTIILLVESIDKSVRFYKEKIGMPLRFKSPGWAEFVIGDVHLALHRRDCELATDNVSTPSVGISVNLEVDDIDEMLIRLASQGIDSVGGVQHYEFGRYFFVTDPDGYIVGFREYKKEYSAQLPS
jgi:catechol 2,3-dioxygenase-like lactoylglutathione lyase family enzyme